MALWRNIAITVAATLAIVVAALVVAVIVMLAIGQGRDFDIDRMLGIVGATGVLASLLRLVVRRIGKWLDTDDRDE